MIEFISRVKTRWFSNRFYSYIYKLSSRTLVAHIIIIALSPILTRIYTANDFGGLAIFQSIVVLIGTITTLSFEHAIVIPKSTRVSKSLTVLALVLNLTSVLLLSFSFWVFNSHLSSLFKLSSTIILLIPLAIFCNNTISILTYWTIRQEGFKQLSTSKIVQNGSNGFLQILLGFLNLTTIGLQTGYIFGRALSSLFLVFSQKKRVFYLLFKNKTSHLSQTFRDFSEYPKFVLLSNILSIAGLEAPVFLTSIYFSNDLVGYYGLSHRLLSIPFALLGASVGQVFFQRFSDKVARSEITKNLLLKTWKGLVLIGFVPFSIIFFFGEQIFGFVFGINWIESGYIAGLISPLLFFQFISSTTGKSLLTLNKEHLMPIFSLFHFIARAGGILIGVYLKDFYTGLITFVVLNIISLLIYNLFLYHFSSKHDLSLQ